MRDNVDRIVELEQRIQAIETELPKWWKIWQECDPLNPEEEERQDQAEAQIYKLERERDDIDDELRPLTTFVITRPYNSNSIEC
jgi:vacuolar-type H+-ATPase subunit I/STV1